MAYIGRDIDKISNVEVLDNITFDGSSSYTLQKGGSNFTPSSANTLLVSIDGVVQAGNFTVSGSTINFGTAVSASSTCNFILHYGVGLITAPADGTVTTAKLADSSVSLAKLTATGTKDATTFLRGDNTFAVPAGGANTPYFQAYRSGSQQSISGGTWTKVQINSEVVDSDSAYDNSTNYRFTPLTSGKYYIFGQVTSATSTDLDRVMSAIYLNGSQISQSNSFNGDSSSSYTATIVDMNGSSDYVELYGYFGLTAGTDLQGRATFFGGYKLID